MPISPIWPAATAVNAEGSIEFHGRTAESLLDEFGSPLYLIDTDEVVARARHFVRAAAEAFNTSTTHVSFAGKAFLSKEIVRLVTEAGMFVDTCTMGEMKIALAAGVPGRRLVLHGNNKSDEEIALAIEQGFAKIVIDEPDEPERVAAIARKLGKRARVMLRVTVGVHAGGHEYISTAHEDQKFGVPLLAAGADAAVLDVLNDLKDVTPAATNARISATHSPENGAEKTEKSERELHYDVKYPYDLSHEEVSDTDKALAAAMEAIADGPSIAVLKTILANQDVLELVGAHSHIGSNIHDADAFIHAAKRMMLLRKTLWATDAYITNRALGMPAPAISFEPGRYIVAPAGVTLYRVGTIKHVHLSDAKDSDGNPIAERVYVSVDGGMSDNIRPALYGADYTARLANRTGSAETMLARVCGMHCESGDIVVHEVQLPADLKRGDILAVPVTGAYGRTMASNYNQALIPAVVAVSESGAHVMLRRQTVDDLLNLDVSE